MNSRALRFSPRRLLTPFWFLIFVLSIFSTARAAEMIPPKPTRYFNDYANKVDAAYDRAKFLDERKIMMQEWADYLDKVVQTGKVVHVDFGHTA